MHTISFKSNLLRKQTPLLGITEKKNIVKQLKRQNVKSQSSKYEYFISYSTSVFAFCDYIGKTNNNNKKIYINAKIL